MDFKYTQQMASLGTVGGPWGIAGGAVAGLATDMVMDAENNMKQDNQRMKQGKENFQQYHFDPYAQQGGYMQGKAPLFGFARGGKVRAGDPPKNFEARMNDPFAPRLKNPDGTYSTHSMASAEVDGRFLAYPTVVQQGDSLVRLGDKEALDYALKSKEYREFPSEKASREYAEGGYKKGTFLERREVPAPEGGFAKGGHVIPAENAQEAVQDAARAGIDLRRPAKRVNEQVGGVITGDGHPKADDQHMVVGGRPIRVSSGEVYMDDNVFRKVAASQGKTPQEYGREMYPNAGAGGQGYAFGGMAGGPYMNLPNQYDAANVLRMMNQQLSAPPPAPVPPILDQPDPAPAFDISSLSRGLLNTDPAYWAPASAPAPAPASAPAQTPQSAPAAQFDLSSLSAGLLNTDPAYWGTGTPAASANAAHSGIPLRSAGNPAPAKGGEKAGGEGGEGGGGDGPDPMEKLAKIGLGVNTALALGSTIYNLTRKPTSIPPPVQFQPTLLDQRTDAMRNKFAQERKAATVSAAYGAKGRNDLGFNLGVVSKDVDARIKAASLLEEQANKVREYNNNLSNQAAMYNNRMLNDHRLREAEAADRFRQGKGAAVSEGINMLSGGLGNYMDAKIQMDQSKSQAAMSAAVLAMLGGDEKYKGMGIEQVLNSAYSNYRKGTQKQKSTTNKR